jgi:hypothetical protein
MWIVAIAWMYVVVMMTVAEAAAPHGAVLAAIGIFFFYGLFPVALVMYLLNTPRRRSARQAKEAHEAMAFSSPEPLAGTSISTASEADASRLASGDAIAPEGEESRRV